jgi:hypothetical protein
MTRAFAIVATAALLGSTALPAVAAGRYDGRWIVDLPGSELIAQTTSYRCAPERLNVQIIDNQVRGTLERIPARNGSIVQPGNSNLTAAPVLGRVTPDGIVHARWRTYTAAGRLGDDTGRLRVAAACGLRTATAGVGAPGLEAHYFHADDVLADASPS